MTEISHTPPAGTGVLLGDEGESRRGVRDLPARAARHRAHPRVRAPDAPGRPLLAVGGRDLERRVPRLRRADRLVRAVVLAGGRGDPGRQPRLRVPRLREPRRARRPGRRRSWSAGRRSGATATACRRCSTGSPRSGSRSSGSSLIVFVVEAMFAREGDRPSAPRGKAAIILAAVAIQFVMPFLGHATIKTMLR